MFLDPFLGATSAVGQKSTFLVAYDSSSYLPCTPAPIVADGGLALRSQGQSLYPSGDAPQKAFRQVNDSVRLVHQNQEVGARLKLNATGNFVANTFMANTKACIIASSAGNLGVMTSMTGVVDDFVVET